MANYGCKAPWTWLVINLEQNTWRYCCKTDWQKNFSDSYDSKKNPVLIKVRQEFLNDSKPIECSSCWREEDSNGVSYRTQIIGPSSHEQMSNYKGLEYADIIFGNLCNLRCASCGPLSSTQWSTLLTQQKEIVPFSWLTPLPQTTPNKQSWERIPEIVAENIDTLDHLNLYGGEPSIDPNFIDLIDRLCDLDISRRISNPIKLRIYTNGIWPESDKLSKKFVDNLYRAQSKGWIIDLKFSIDGVGEDAEYIRHPSKWSTLDKNLDNMALAGFTTQIHITSSLLNFPVQHKILEYFADKPYRNLIRPIPNLANQPSIISIANLGSNISRYVHGWNDLPDLPTWRWYKNWIKGIVVKQQNGIPDAQRLKYFVKYANWYAGANSTTIPTELDNFYQSYLE